MIRSGRSINRSYIVNSLLIDCLEATDLEKTKTILKRYLEMPGSDINACLDINRAAIHISVMCSDIPAVQLLLQKGANINCTSKKGLPLLIAIEKTDTDMVRFLLENEADVSLIDQKKITNETILKLLSEYSQTVRAPLPLPLLISYTNSLPSVICNIINSYLPISKTANQVNDSKKASTPSK